MTEVSSGDALADVLLSTCRVSLDQYDASCAYPMSIADRLGDYKAKPRSLPGQEERRQACLDRQRKKRLDRANYARKLADADVDPDSFIEDFEKQPVEEMDIADSKELKERRFNPFKNQIMLSEWLIDVPEDLEHEWVTTVCPVGKRCLVVANRGQTSAYTKSGYCVNRFPSLLPGGCRKMFKPGEHTILDCIYNETQRKFYILDIMCWKGHPVYDSETEFRFFWLRTKLEEQSDVQTKNKVNPYIFEAVPCYGGSVSEIYKAATTDHGFQVDGLLFYHKRVHYLPERTPLVGWLKQYMIPDILGIALPVAFLQNKPPVNKMSLIQANKDLKDTIKDRPRALEKRTRGTKNAKQITDDCTME